MRETSPKLLRLKYLIRWAQINGVKPKGPGAKPNYGIYYITSFHQNGGGKHPSGRPSSVEATYLEGHDLWELGPAEMKKAEATEAELEAEHAKGRLVWASPELYDAIEASHKRCKREDIKACADKTVIGPPHADDVVRWMTLAMEVTGSKTPIVIGASGATLFFFTCGEQEALRRLAALPDAVRVASPKKVLVKMLAARMRAIQEVVQNENANRARTRDEDARQATLKPGDPGHYPNWVPRGQPDLESPEMNGMDECRNAVAALQGLNWHAKKPCKEMLEVLEKDNMDEDVAREAWDQIVVRNVLEA